MKGNIFIGWCDNNSLAIKVNERLSREDYNCVVGGNYNQDLDVFIGGTVIKQLQNCNQSIFIIKKGTNGIISNNITFEIGYSLSKYNASIKKLHIYYVDIEPKDECIPSDLLGAWALHIDSSAKNDDEIADIIVEDFLNNQRITIIENKLDLMSSWHRVHLDIMDHITFPKYSDYELAQYILFYVAALHFVSECSLMKSDTELLRRHVNENSIELYDALVFAHVVLELSDSIQTVNNHYYIDDIAYFDFTSQLKKAIDSLNMYDDVGVENDTDVEYEFKLWFLLFAYDQLAYIEMLYANNPELNSKELMLSLDNAYDLSAKTLSLCDELTSRNPYKNKEVATMYKSFSYRIFSIIYNERNDKDNETRYRMLTYEKQKDLRDQCKSRNIDSKLHELFEQEYFLSLAELIDYVSDARLKRAYKKEIDAYVNYMITIHESTDVYINRIKMILSNEKISGM